MSDSYQPDAASERDIRSAGAAAQVHGLLTALACIPGTESSWREVVQAQLGKAEDAERERFYQTLGRIFVSVRQALSAEGFEFSPLLPDDDRSLPERTEALAGWCRGFTDGLLIAGEQEVFTLQGEVGEFIRDLGELAHAEMDSEESEQAQEKALAELVEYLRVGVSLVHDTLHQRSKTPSKTQPS